MQFQAFMLTTHEFCDGVKAFGCGLLMVKRLGNG